MGFWQNVWDFLGAVSDNESYKRGFSDGYYGNPRNQAYLRDDYYNAGYNDGRSARESGKTFE